MSTRERYIKVIESLVNGEEAKAADHLHEAFVEKAREIWNDLVEQDEIIEDEVAEEESVDETVGGDKADDFIDDIEEDDDEIEAEEMYGEDKVREDDDEEMSEPEAEMELSDEEPKDGDDVDFDGDGETDDHEEDHEEIKDKLVNVEDALADLKTEFAKIMGDSEEEAPAEEMPEMPEMESTDTEAVAEPTLETKADDADEEKVEEAKDDAEEDENLEEAAELKKIGKDGMHPKDMPAGDDGKASPVAGKNDMGGKAVDMSKKSSEGSKKGLVDAPKDMGVTHPGDGAKLSPEAKGHGAEKKGKAE
tara:strand:+ start:246 stop:1163 length:918 start_codon:yes stop_codon:yes gene_type:complete